MKRDLFYNSEKSTADNILADEAIQRFYSEDAFLGKKLAALGLTGVMKAKVKLGMGLKCNKSQQRQMINKCLNIVEKTKTLTANNLRSLQTGIEILNGDYSAIKKPVF